MFPELTGDHRPVFLKLNDQVRTYTCTCGNQLFFVNSFCLSCNSELAFCPRCRRLSPIDPDDEGLYRCRHAGCQARHYRSGPPADWQDRFISAYASMYPWEDFAETFAAYLDMVCLLDSSSSGVARRPCSASFAGRDACRLSAGWHHHERNEP
ncbi:MAG: putative zinc-binding metallopeptidase [Pirellulales bacterium]